MRMNNDILDRLAWWLLYSGLLVLIVGVWVSTAAVGRIVAAVGGLVAVAGVAVLWWRTRRPDEPLSDPADDNRRT